MSLMTYHVGGEEVGSALAFLERALQRYARTGAVVAGDHVNAAARTSTGNGHKPKPRRWHKHRPLDRGTRRAIAEAYMGPERMIDIANRFNCSTCTVRIVAVAEGCPVRRAGCKGGMA